MVATYTYDPWGAPTGIYDANGSTISQTAYHVAAYNPFRYRGYRYDGDTRLYYLQSRYYDPVVGRFINADGYASTGQGLIGHNMFAYCNSAPVGTIDSCGQIPSHAVSVSDGSSKPSLFGTRVTIVHTKQAPPIFRFTFGAISVTAGTRTSTSQKASGSSRNITAYHNVDATHPYLASTSGVSFHYENSELNLFTGMENLGISFSSNINENEKFTSSLSFDTTKLELKYENSITATWDKVSETSYANITANGPLLFLYSVLSPVMGSVPGPISDPSFAPMPAWG